MFDPDTKFVLQCFSDHLPILSVFCCCSYSRGFFVFSDLQKFLEQNPDFPSCRLEILGGSRWAAHKSCKLFSWRLTRMLSFLPRKVAKSLPLLEYWGLYGNTSSSISRSAFAALLEETDNSTALWWGSGSIYIYNKETWAIFDLHWKHLRWKRKWRQT